MKGYVHVLFKVLLLVCLKIYRAQSGNQVANKVRGEAEGCYIPHNTLIKNCMCHTKQAAVLQMFCSTI